MKYSILTLFLIYICFGDSKRPAVFESKKTERDSYAQESDKNQAFTVLQEKCNICHATKKKTDIFTYENMDSLAPDINKQVFVKRKMPKGRKVKLTEEEAQQLETWLNTILVEK